MPFAFRDVSEDVDIAIDDYSNKVLFFAAASNECDQSLGFPASHSKVFCIYSNKNHKDPSGFCKHGQENKFNFSTIGEKVNAAWPSGLPDEKRMERQTGTSCSTPIAAGVAALILEFATQPGNFSVRRAYKLKMKDVMEKVLFECMTERHTTGVYNLIKPWKLLGIFDEGKMRTFRQVKDAIEAQINGCYSS